MEQLENLANRYLRKFLDESMPSGRTAEQFAYRINTLSSALKILGLELHPIGTKNVERYEVRVDV